MIFAGLESPFLGSGCGIKRIEKRVPAADKECSAANRGRSVYHVTGFEFPLERPASRVQSVNIGVAGTEIDQASRNYRRGQEKIEGVGHDLGGGFDPVDMLCGEAMFSAGFEFPFEGAGGGVQRIKIGIVTEKKEQTVGDRRGRRNTAAGFKFPFLRSAGQIDRVEKVIVAAEIDDAVRDHRRRENLAAGVELPFDFVEFVGTRSRKDTGVSSITAKRRGLLRERGRTNK